MTNQSERAKARSARINAFNMSVQIRPDSPNRRTLYDAIQKQTLNAQDRRKIKEFTKRGAALAAVQRSGGSDLYVDRYLRHFISEYNGRLFQGEGMHMPSSFNIVGSFLEPAEDAFILKLLPQYENILSFNKMLDHITDPKSDTSLKFASSDMEELTIYEINMLGGHAAFKVPGSDNFVFCGVACCREGNEVSLMGIFGRENPNPVKKRDSVDPKYLNPDKLF
ncbi:hypothetical protein [Sphingomonas sp. 35-24ZXX]|uniref:hypothetical protein n=1 Tax=Sphingomonas sp. 35-24ZXX TaxID=1545915 RepID=UPI0012E09916|nr:hypothetical protein [Sphingomonas sp. 35-24ZXX]